MTVIHKKYPPLLLEELVRDIKLFPGLATSEKMTFITRVINTHPVLHTKCTVGGNVFRVRNIDGQHIDTLEDIFCPPTAQGQDNRFGRMYYVATNQHTALAETENGKRETVVMVRYKQIQPCLLYTAGEEDTIFRGGYGIILNECREIINNQLKQIEEQDYDAAMSWAIQAAFIAEQCASTERDISQCAFNAIMSQYPGIEAISYASLKRKEGYNLALPCAIFFDKWIIQSVTKMHVECLPCGYYSMTTLATVTAIDKGRFTWETNNGHERTETFL